MSVACYAMLCYAKENLKLILHRLHYIFQDYQLSNTISTSSLSIPKWLGKFLCPHWLITELQLVENSLKSKCHTFHCVIVLCRHQVHSLKVEKQIRVLRHVINQDSSLTIVWICLKLNCIALSFYKSPIALFQHDIYSWENGITNAQ